MKPRQTARVFEYDRLRIDEQGLTPAHFDTLAKYSDRTDGKFFRPGHRCIHFGGHVGVVQVGNLTIEILPKADRHGSPDKDIWRNALLEMLRTCRLLNLDSLTNAHLRLRSASMVDLYFLAFLREVRDVVHGGMVKGYRQQHGNLSALKGSIDFPRHLSQNLVRRDRFYTRHTVYDRDKLHNQLLKKALCILDSTARNPHIASEAADLGLHFEEVSDLRVTPDTFRRLTYSRNTERYRTALQLARLIILNYSPDLRGGHEHVLAILFDMPMLYEEYVYRLLKKAAKDSVTRVSRQESAVFWEGPGMRKSIRPDIVIDHEGHRFVLDTKWKVPSDGRPSDADLKQMYAYNLQFGSKHSFLIYPRVGTRTKTSGTFHPMHQDFGEHAHSCHLQYMRLFDSSGKELDKNAGEEVLHLLNAHQPLSLKAPDNGII